MTASNLAAIFTPNILKPEDGHHAAITGELELSNHTSCVGIVEFLIENHRLVGMPPHHVLRRASEYGGEARAKSDYLSRVNGRRKWWRLVALYPFFTAFRP
jgi:hypothetical protein